MDFFDEWLRYITGSADPQPSTATTLYDLMVPPE